LFETLEDLEHAPAVVRSLLDDPIWRRQLEARGRHQEVMLGYSDSAKDAGLLPSAWALYRVQEEVARTCADAGVSWTLFHGRGGALPGGHGPPGGEGVTAVSGVGVRQRRSVQTVPRDHSRAGARPCTVRIAPGLPGPGRADDRGDPGDSLGVRLDPDATHAPGMARGGDGARSRRRRARWARGAAPDGYGVAILRRPARQVGDGVRQGRYGDRADVRARAGRRPRAVRSARRRVPAHGRRAAAHSGERVPDARQS